MKLFKSLAFCSLVSCMFINSSCETKHNNEVPTVSPLNFEELSDISSIVSEITFVQLETHQSCLLVNPQKIFKTRDNKILIHDTNRVLVFDINGMFIRHIGNYGKGPGEYTHINDIALSFDEKFLYTLDPYSKIRKYSLTDGSFIEEIVVSNPSYKNFDAIAASSDGNFFLFASNPNDIKNFTEDFYCLSKYNKSGKLISEHLIRNDFLFNPFRITRSYCGNYFVRPIESDNTLHIIENGKVNEFLKFDFGKKSIPNKHIFKFGNNPWEHIQDLIGSPYFKLLMGFLDSKQQMYFYCVGENYFTYEFIFSTESLEGFYWKSNDPNPLTFMFTDSKYFYGLVDNNMFIDNKAKETIISPLKKYVLEKYNLKSDEDNNPVLFRVKIKK